MITEEYRLPAAIPADSLPADEVALLTFIYQNGYTLKTDKELAAKFHIKPERVTFLIGILERNGWIHSKVFRYTNSKQDRMICAAL